VRQLLRTAFVVGVLFAGATLACEAAGSGAELFEANCQICHQAHGVGVGGQYPRLAGRASVTASSREGRKFMSQLVLNGMSGKISVDNQFIVGFMPGFERLSDEDVAAILTYISGLESDQSMRPLRPRKFAPSESGAGSVPARWPRPVTVLRARG
jgi:mono/diheme cytochrome c family protein